MTIEYEKTWFWIDDADFDSKYAFTVVNVVLDLSLITSATGAVVTIPAG